jgi:hypothetical protein
MLATYTNFPGVQVKEQRWTMDGHFVKCVKWGKMETTLQLTAATCT